MTIVFSALLFVFVGFFLPSSFFEKFDHSAAGGDDLDLTKDGEKLKNSENDSEAEEEDQI